MSLSQDEIRAAFATASSSLRFLFAEAEIDDQLQGALFQAGFTTIRLFSRIAEDAAELKGILKDDFGCDPATGLVNRVKAARLLSAWSTARDSASKEDEAKAESKLTSLPRPVGSTEYHAMRVAYEGVYGTLSNKYCPSRHFVGIKLEQVEENEPRVELLRDVTSRDDAEASFVGASVDDRGVVRVNRTSAPNSRRPRDPEELRLRHRVLGNAWFFTKFKHGQRAWLQDFSPSVLPAFSDYLLGKSVHGLRFRGYNGREEGPSWHTILSFEYEVRKWVYQQVVDKGVSLKSAFESAEENADLRDRFLVTPLALDSSARTSLSVGPSSSWLGEGKGRGQGGKGQWGNSGSKGKGGKKGKNRDSPYGKGKGRGKGSTPDGRQICYAFNDGSCQGNCGRVHVCLICLQNHAAKDHYSAKGSGKPTGS